MDLIDLRYLSMAVETGSFTHAAQLLGVKPSTISRRITRLEDELGVTMFERGSFGIRLTAAGRVAMVEFRRGLDAIENEIRSGRSTSAAKRARLRLDVRMAANWTAGAGFAGQLPQQASGRGSHAS